MTLRGLGDAAEQGACSWLSSSPSLPSGGSGRRYPRYAARSYSWISPPSTSRRRTDQVRLLRQALGRLPAASSAAADKQDPVEAFPADRVGPALGVRPRLRRPYRRLDDASPVGADVETGRRSASRTVDGEQVAFEDARRLRSQERRPARIEPLRCRLDPASLRIAHTALAASLTPSPTSSPWIRREPQLGFSRVSRTAGRFRPAGTTMRIRPTARDQL